jgi:hypothetical protein
MYMVVLMAAMTTSIDVPDFGHRHGYYGSYGGCYGGGFALTARTVAPSSGSR